MRLPDSSASAHTPLPSLLEDLETGAIVITANNRVAAWIRQSFDLRQQRRGLGAWPTPQVLPWNAWIRALWQRMRASDAGVRELLLTPWQAQRIWSEIVAASSRGTLLHPANAVQLAMRAWETAQGWNGPWAQWGGEAAREEQRSFVEWAGAFARRCADNGWIDAPRLPLLIADALRDRRLVVDQPVRLYGFAEFSPRQQQLIDALNNSGARVSIQSAIDPNAGHAGASRVACPDPAGEYRRCAQWSRELLARDPSERIGVVIPDLTERKRQVERVFAEMLGPQSLLQGKQAHAAFNISRGDPLAGQPLVEAALALLHWTQHPIDLARLSALVRSSHVAMLELERAGRAKLLRDAIGEPHDKWPLAAFARFAARYAPVWSERLKALAAIGATWRTRRAAREWRSAWEEALEAAGWLLDHSLDSAEFQARKAWREMLDAWMRDENIAGATTIDAALASLRELAEATIFQPERPAAPVQILGFLEAAGLQFDSLWVCGLTAERWPPAPAPNALLPLAWQRAVNAPHASAARELRYYRELTAQFASAADAVIFSWPARIDDIPQTPSPLLAEFSTEWTSDLLDDRQPGLAQLIRVAGKLEAIDDRNGLRFPDDLQATGSASLLGAQAHCPFHAYARSRLKADPWPEPLLGLNLMERGTLVHAVLAEFWSKVRDHATLVAMAADERDERIAVAVDTALEKVVDRRRWEQLGRAMRDLERERLVALLDEWLRLEAARPPFTVVGSESKQPFNLGGMQLNLRIDRIDSVGDDDRWIVTDYKTGKSKIMDLLLGRLVEPQLPLYAEALAPTRVVGVAYGSVQRGACKASGIGISSDDWPAIKPALPDWPTRRAEWRAALDALVADYLAGVATVDPWRDASCNRCHRQALCRINERVGFVGATETDATEGG